MLGRKHTTLLAVPLLAILLFGACGDDNPTDSDGVRRPPAGQQAFGGDNIDIGWSVAATSDGGCVIVGETYSLGIGNADVYLVKTNSSGKLLWQKTFGAMGRDVGFCVIQLVGGGYVIAGETESFGHGGTDMYLAKTDGIGNRVWEKTLGGPYGDGARAVAETPDGGFIVAGWTGSFGDGGANVYVVKTDALGNLVWQKVFGGDGDDWAYSVLSTATSDYIIGGYSESFVSGTGGLADFYLIKINPEGQLVWQHTYGNEFANYGRSMIPAADGGYVMAGSGVPGFYLVKADSAGTRQWEAAPVADIFDGGYAVAPGLDDGYVIAGMSSTGSANTQDVYLIGTDSLGAKTWERTYGGNLSDRAWSIARAANGGYFVVGETESYGAGLTDVYLIITNAYGDSQ